MRGVEEQSSAQQAHSKVNTEREDRKKIRSHTFRAIDRAYEIEREDDTPLVGL